MENNKTKQVKLLLSKHIVAAICFVLILFVAFIAPLSALRTKPDPLSGDTIIRKYAAEQLSELYGDRLTDADFAKISELYLYDIFKYNHREFTYLPPWILTELTDIRLLEKFTNLEILDLYYVRYPEIRIPKWMKFLGKHRIINLDKKFAIDLSPIQNLHALKKLRLSNAQIYDIKPLKKLTNLEELYIQNCPNITDKQVEDLQKALPGLKITR
ncbi:MAG: leucine-rich repeat domain-containing protein [Sedimentisphaerales bacterium]|nr:leucine-rich repeat domain-containing protein [Sedimentisphaerales bacterium]